MFELSKMFLLCLNYWKLETPTQFRQRSQKDDGTAYKVDYTRCVCVCVCEPCVVENIYIFNLQRIASCFFDIVVLHLVYVLFMWRSHCILLFLFPSIVTHNYCNLICVLFPRWLCYCHVPQSNDSLPRYETTQVFGRSLLKSIFTVTRRQLLEKFRVEKDKLLPEKRTLILTHFPKYVVCNQSVVIRSESKLILIVVSPSSYNRTKILE